MMSTNAGHVFVSHSSDNRELAVELAGFLEGRGLRVWIAPRDVRPGMDYSEELQKAIEQSAAFVVLVTEMANKSPYVRAETEMAFSSHKPIFPVRTTEIQPAPGLAFFLKIRHWTDAFGNLRTDNLERLVRELQAHAAAAAQAGAAASAAGAAAGPAEAAPPPPPPPPPSPPRPPPATAPDVPLPVLPLLPADADEEQKWRVAVGPRADYYLDRWRTMAEKNKSVSWNWPACLASLFWFAYRKMWLPMVGVLVASLVLGVIGGANPAAGTASLLLSIGLTFVTGAFGNHLYRRHISRLVAETSTLERGPQLETLRKRGGVSAPALAVSLALVGMFVLLAMLAAIGARQQLDQTNALSPYDQNYDGQAVPVQPDKPPADAPPQDDYYQEGY
ncbi:MAG: TIR domain-containing protein [Allosphingosinicella sp.]